VREGEVHAIMGENGAGKSTLLNILSGAISEYEGRFTFKGSQGRIRNPQDARRRGINMVHQELSLIPFLSVGQNVFLGSEPRIGGTPFIDWKSVYSRTEELLQTLEANFGSRDTVAALSTAQMQLVEIAKALLNRSRVLALDEPTSSLSSHEIQKLFDVIKRLRDSGTAIVFISHRLDEVFEIANRITVLKDGRCVGTLARSDVTKPMLVRLMVGREVLESAAQRPQSLSNAEVVLELKNLSARKRFHGVSFALRKGEVLGIAGLVGAGRTDVARSIFGAEPIDEGEIHVHGQRVSIRTPSDALRLGIGLIPEDRKLHGFVGIRSNASNVGLGSMRRLARLGFVWPARRNANADEFMRDLRVNPHNVDMPTKNLSGGNQQKVVVAKWLSSKARILIVDEPTRGIDVGAKADVYRIIDQLVGQGFAIILISSELREIIGMSDRILVMREGRIVRELTDKRDFSEEQILKSAMGVSYDARA